MSSKPSLDELDELLKLAESETYEEDTQSKNDIVAFLSTFQIKPGPNIIRLQLLYELYSLWSKNPITKNRFGKELNKFLISSAHHTYRLNAAAFKLSKKAYDLLQEKTCDKTKSKKYKRHFEAFIKHYELKKGTFYLEWFVIHYLYDLWSNRKTNHLGEVQFQKFLALYFPMKQPPGSVQYFGVDRSILRFLPQEHIEQIRLARKQYNEKRRKEKNKKKLR